MIQIQTDQDPSACLLIWSVPSVDIILTGEMPCLTYLSVCFVGFQPRLSHYHYIWISTVDQILESCLFVQNRLCFYIQDFQNSFFEYSCLVFLSCLVYDPEMPIGYCRDGCVWLGLQLAKLALKWCYRASGNDRLRQLVPVQNVFGGEWFLKVRFVTAVHNESILGG